MKVAEAKPYIATAATLPAEPVAGVAGATRARAGRRPRRRWFRFLHALYVLEYLLARHHRLGWAPELDEAALKERTRRLATLRAEGR